MVSLDDLGVGEQKGGYSTYMWSQAEPVYRIATHSTAKAWRYRLGRYRLMGTHCPSCGMDHFPERYVCPKCHETELEAKEFSRTGHVVCRAVDYSPVMGHAEEIPKPFAVVKLDDGPSVTADIVDCSVEELRDGMPVEMVLRKWRRETNGCYMYGYKFRPLLKGEE